MAISILVNLLLVLGLLAAFLPVLPGPFIAFSGIVLHKLSLGEASVAWSFVGFALFTTLLTLWIDLWCTWWGAKRYGASWKGALGAVLGGILGLVFFNLPGLILGPVVGAVLFEILDHRTGPEAARAGFGTIVGAVLALFLKLGLTIGMVAAFYLAVPSG